MRALRLGQMSAKSISCYASSVAPVFVRFHTPYNYSSPAVPRTLWEGLWNGFLFDLRFILADSTNLHEKIFHYSQLTAACLVPVSFVLAPSALCVGSQLGDLECRCRLITFCACCTLSTVALVWATSSVITADLWGSGYGVTSRCSARAWRSLLSSYRSLVCLVFSTLMPPPMVWLPLLRPSGDRRSKIRMNNCYHFFLVCLGKTGNSFSTFALQRDSSSGQMLSNTQRVRGSASSTSHIWLKRRKWGVVRWDFIASSL